jgi:hypothetical protein
VDRQL